MVVSNIVEDSKKITGVVASVCSVTTGFAVHSGIVSSVVGSTVKVTVLTSGVFGSEVVKSNRVVSNVQSGVSVEYICSSVVQISGETVVVCGSVGSVFGVVQIVAVSVVDSIISLV